MTAKAFIDGTHRALPPEETVRRLRGRLGTFGITRVADVTGLDRVGIPVVTACRPAARSLAVSMGKGVTLAAARASAIMESVELWHAERPVLPLVWGRARDLESAYHIADWSGLARTAGAGFDSTTTAWVEARSLVDDTAALLPYEVVHTDGRTPEPAGGGWFLSTSNGLASGNNIVEAKLHAVCEVVERDAVTLWRLAGDAYDTAIDLGSISDPVSRSLVERFDEAGLALMIHDATSDIGVATVQCTVFEPDADDPDLTVHATSGMGCHPSRTVALCRALTEAAQSRLALISGARDDLFRAHYQPSPTAREQARLLRELWRLSSGAKRAIADLPELSTDTLENDLEVITASLVAQGFHPWWVDLAQPDLGIAVGRAVVPGLEQLSDVNGYVPGARARAAIGRMPQ